MRLVDFVLSRKEPRKPKDYQLVNDISVNSQMLEIIKDFIGNIKSNPSIVTFDEAATKQAIILPLLQRLGWNTDNIDEVIPEYPIESKKVDYSLNVNGTHIFLEVKRIGVDLERFEKQLLEYSFLRGVEFAILTSGTAWWFYLPMKMGDWQTRRFDMIDLIQQESMYVAQKFVDLLSKDNVQTARALQNAEAIYSAKTIAEALPLAWNKLIASPTFHLSIYFPRQSKRCAAMNLK